MKKREYRIAYREGYNEYYPETRVVFLGIPVTRWRRIAEHSGGTFGLYDTLEYPKLNKEDAENLIWKYKRSLTPKKMIYIPYEE